MQDTSQLRCWAEIDTHAIRQNARALRSLQPTAGLLAIVKADAYGHGTSIVTPAIEDTVEMFGVATLAEAMALDTRRPVLLLSPCLPGELAQALAHGFIPSLSTIEEIEGCAQAATALGHPAQVHLVVDTGMGRIGFAPEALAEALHHVASHPSLILDGLATHLPSADDDPEFTSAQLSGFQKLLDSVASLLPAGIRIHCLNSAGLLRFPSHARALARVGLALYGIPPIAPSPIPLKPAMSVHARVTLVRTLPPGHPISYGRTFVTRRTTRVATLAIGYADGYPRALSGRGAHVLIHGTPCPVLGRITMDQIMVDVTDAPPVAPADTATLLGTQGELSITASHLANLAGTIPWEILTGIQQRVVRIQKSSSPNQPDPCQPIEKDAAASRNTSFHP